MASNPSGLSLEHRIRARDRTVHAALLALHNAPEIHYTQGARRWDGISDHRNARRGQFPRYADCSSLATWCLWNGLWMSGYTKRDLVNGLSWRAGYTGTMLSHGAKVSTGALQRGDCVFYGRGFPANHVSIVVAIVRGTPMVVSHGSERGPLYVPFNYRGDVLAARRFI